MRKILIFLRIPSVGSEYEVYVPDHVCVRKLIPLLSDAVFELTRHLYVPSGSETLCCAEQNILLDENKTLSDYEIGNGDHLVMI